MNSSWSLSHRTFLIFALLLTAVAWPIESDAAQLTLTWTDNSTNEDGFKIERKTGTTGTYAQIAVTGANVTSYTDSTLADGTTYCYRLRAYNSAGDSAYSNEACGTTPQTFALAVVKGGTGNGTVTSTPAGITCGADCSEPYASGTAVTLTATPAAGSTFTGWSGGGCTGTGSCTVTLTAATTVTATFTLQTFTLTVSKAGTGSGTVTSAPAGITCGADCSEPYTSGTAVTLTATPAAGSTFGGWSGGGCTGTGSCTVTLTAATTVTATFNVQTFTLTVSKAGTGSGTVTSAPAGITCGADCSEPYMSGTAVTLTATPAAGSTFGGWSGGGCTGTGSCTVTLTATTTVTATFTLQTFTLTVSKAGTGSGTVTSTPAGINCGADCSEPYTSGTSVTLSGSPSAGSTFSGWSGGGCTGTGSCTVTLTAATTVTATFNPAVTPPVAPTGLQLQ